MTANAVVQKNHTHLSQVLATVVLVAIYFAGLMGVSMTGTRALAADSGSGMGRGWGRGRGRGSGRGRGTGSKRGSGASSASSSSRKTTGASKNQTSTSSTSRENTTGSTNSNRSTNSASETRRGAAKQADEKPKKTADKKSVVVKNGCRETAVVTLRHNSSTGLPVTTSFEVAAGATVPIDGKIQPPLGTYKLLSGREGPLSSSSKGDSVVMEVCG